MNKEFIPYEQALALKELGFDEPCMSSRDMNNGEGLIQIPLYQQAFRWFREEHKLFTSINVNYCYIIYKDDELYEESNDYKTYEEAELECLKQLIKIVKEKK